MSSAFIFGFNHFLEARAKKCTKCCWSFGGWENLVFCFRYLLTFTRTESKQSKRIVCFYSGVSQYGSQVFDSTTWIGQKIVENFVGFLEYGRTWYFSFNYLRTRKILLRLTDLYLYWTLRCH